MPSTNPDPQRNTPATPVWTLDELADIPLQGTRDQAELDWERKVDAGLIRYTGPSRVHLPSVFPKDVPPPTRAEVAATVARFLREVPREYAALAMSDPDEDSTTRVRARQYLLEQAEADEVARHSQVVGGPVGQRESGRELLTRLGAAPDRGRGVMRCPAHEDRSPSLSWRLAPDGRALLNCFAGCSFEAILAAAT